MPASLLLLLIVPVLGWLVLPRWFHGRDPALEVPACWFAGASVLGLAKVAILDIAGAPAAPAVAWGMVALLLAGAVGMATLTGTIAASRVWSLWTRGLAALRSVAGRWGVRELAVATPFVLVCVLAALKALLLPPLTWDAVTYHAYIPLDSFLSGSTRPPPGIGIGMADRTFPDLTADLGLWGMLLQGEADLDTLRWLPLVNVALLLVLSFGMSARVIQEIAGRPSAVPTVDILMRPPLIALLPVLPAALALSDLSLVTYASDVWDVPALALAILLCADALGEFGRRGDVRSLALASVWAGAATMAKLSGLILLAALPLAALVALGRARLRARLATIATSVVPGTLLVMPILIRNWLLAGNPLYPFLNDTIGGPGSEVLALLQRENPLAWELGVRLGNVLFLFSRLAVVLPLVALLVVRPPRWCLAVTTLAVVYLVAVVLLIPYGNSPFRYAFAGIPALATTVVWIAASPAGPRRAIAGVVFLASAALLSLQVALSKGFDPLIYTTGVGSGLAVSPYRSSGPLTTLWDSGLQSALLILSVICVTWIWWQVWRRPSGGTPRSRRDSRVRRTALAAMPVIAFTVILLPALGQAWVIKHPFYHDGHWATDHSDPEILEAAWQEDYRMWDWMNRNLDPGEKVFSFETRRLYLQVEIVDPSGPQFRATFEGLGPNETVALLRVAGIRYVLDMEAYRYQTWTAVAYPRSSVFSDLLSERYLLVHAEGANRLFRLA